MNILFYTNTDVPHLGGKSSHICDLRDGLIATGNKADIISALSVKGAILKRTKLKKVFIQPLRYIDKWLYSRKSLEITDRAIQQILKEYIRTHKVDLISAQDPISAIYAHELVGDSVPVTLTMHSYFGKGMSDISHDAKGKQHFDIIKERDLNSIEVVRAIVGVDTRIKEDCEIFTKARRPELPVYSIPNFVNTDTYKPATTKEKRDAKQYFNIPESKKVAICIRRLCDKNGVIFAVKAMEKVEDTILLVGGDGPNMESIRNYVREHNLESKVKLLGGVEGEVKANMYAVADYALVPSITVHGLQEATSISAIEAMACGMVLIASGIGGLKELVQNGDNGILVDEQSADQISTVLNDLNHNEQKIATLSEAARKTVIEKYSHIAGANKYLQVFTGAINN